MARHFRIEEAERVLPQVEGLLREAVALKQHYTEAETQWRESSERIRMLGGAVVDRAKLLAQRGRRDALASRLHEIVSSIESHGCLIKDLDVGLLDFPTWFRDREVMLCWRLGESGIAFWHEAQAGYAGRRPIDADFLRHHRGDHPS